jgi:hypothetical protein
MKESSSWYSTCSSLTTSGISGILVDLELTDELDLNNPFIFASLGLPNLDFYCFGLSTARHLSTTLHLCSPTRFSRSYVCVLSEPHCEFPGLLYVPDKEYDLSCQYLNGDWEYVEIECPELGVQLFEEGFLSYYPVQFLEELRDFPPIICHTIKNIQDEQLKQRRKTDHPLVLRIWSTVPEFKSENFMEVKPAKHCIVINPRMNDYTVELKMGRIPLKLDDPLSIMNLWRTVKRGFMINAVQELATRQVLAKNERIIIFGEGMSNLGSWGQLLNLGDYTYSNGRWWSKTYKDPKELIDDNIAASSDGTWHLEYCSTCEEWGHDSCDSQEDWEPISPDNYDPFDEDYYALVIKSLEEFLSSAPTRRHKKTVLSSAFICRHKKTKVNSILSATRHGTIHE